MARLFVFLTAMAAAAAVSAQSMVRVVIDTEHGEIEVAIDQDHAPGTSANFLRYLDAGHYDGGQFHRTVTMQNQPNNDVKIEVIQASVNAAKRGSVLSLSSVRPPQGSSIKTVRFRWRGELPTVRRRAVSSASGISRSSTSAASAIPTVKALRLSG